MNEALKFMGVDVLDKDSVLGVEGRPVFVGGGTDGASVNVGDHTGLKAQLQQALPWLYWSWLTVWNWLVRVHSLVLFSLT